MILATLASVIALTACYYKSDDASARVRVVNACEDSVAVAVGDRADSYQPEYNTASMRVVVAGSQEDLVEPLDYPLLGALYVWVVVPDAQVMGEPQIVPKVDVGETTTSKGGHLYVVEVSGNLCSSS